MKTLLLLFTVFFSAISIAATCTFERLDLVRVDQKRFRFEACSKGGCRVIGYQTGYSHEDALAMKKLTGEIRNQSLLNPSPVIYGIGIPLLAILGRKAGAPLLRSYVANLFKLETIGGAGHVVGATGRELISDYKINRDFGQHLAAAPAIKDRTKISHEACADDMVKRIYATLRTYYFSPVNLTKPLPIQEPELNEKDRGKAHPPSPESDPRPEAQDLPGAASQPKSSTMGLP